MDAVDVTDFQMGTSHPGEHLREDVLPGAGLTAGALARAMGPKHRPRVERLAREQQSINLQTDHDLSKTAIAVRTDLRAIKPPTAA